MWRRRAKTSDIRVRSLPRQISSKDNNTPVANIRNSSTLTCRRSSSSIDKSRKPNLSPDWSSKILSRELKLTASARGRRWNTDDAISVFSPWFFIGAIRTADRVNDICQQIEESIRVRAMHNRCREDKRPRTLLCFESWSRWSWYFLFRGTALSRHTPLNSAPSAKINGSNPSGSGLHDDSRPMLDEDNRDDPLAQPLDRTNEIRRPRVYFADVNRVQFFEDTNDDYEPATVNTKLRRSRHRSAKKSAALLATNPISPPSIQHSQSLYVPYASSSSRPQQPMQELNIRKHHLVSSPRIHSSRFTHLPDILNQSLPSENPIREKYVLQREKPLLRFPEPAAEQSLNSSAEISRESTRAGGMRALVVPNSNESLLRFDPDELGGISTLLHNTFISSIPSGRPRPSLQNLSLRQQFISATKAKPANLLNPSAVRRSISMKQPVTRMHSAEEEMLSGQAHQEPMSTLENRPQTGIRASRRSNRNYVLHFNPKAPFNGNSIPESSEVTQAQQQHNPVLKSSVYDSSQDRLQNPLKILRPSYLSSLNNGPTHETGKKQAEGSVRSSRTNSTRRSYEFQVTSNTIIV